MSRKEASTTIDKQKIFWAIVLFLVVGYVYGRPTLEKWIGRPLPAFGNGNAEQGQADRGADNDSRNDGRSNRDGRSSGAQDNSSVEQSKRQSENAKPQTEEPGTFFRELGRNQRQSPAGLIYGMGPGGVHRLDHVMDHAEDIPSRDVQSVFYGTEQEILEAIDEAWNLAKKGARGVRKSVEGDRTEYTIRMNRDVGYEGGQSGKRKNYPKLQQIKLIVEDDNYIVTAYPYR